MALQKVASLMDTKPDSSGGCYFGNSTESQNQIQQSAISHLTLGDNEFVFFVLLPILTTITKSKQMAF